METLKKEPRGAYHVVVDQKSAVCLVRWHDSKVVTAVTPQRMQALNH